MPTSPQAQTVLLRKPVAVELYIRFMGGVDRADQLMWNLLLCHRTNKWYIKLFGYLFEVVLDNTRIIYSTLNPTMQLKRLPTKFRIEIVEGLFVGYVGSNVRSGRPIVDSPALRQKGENDHTLQPIPGTNAKGNGLIRDCMVCSNTPLAGSSKGARHRSNYEFSECKKDLCIYPCFKRFHSLTVYNLECTEAFHSLPQVPVGSGVKEARPAAECGRRR